MTAAQDADALLIATEWDEFRNPDFDELKTKLREPVIFDGRNIYDIAVLAKHGYHYSSVGRPAVSNMVPVNQAVVQPR
jgi:UDPglucose 6-dehydrogenase